jgi:hypothetical protein
VIKKQKPVRKTTTGSQKSKLMRTLSNLRAIRTKETKALSKKMVVKILEHISYLLLIKERKKLIMMCMPKANRSGKKILK